MGRCRRRGHNPASLVPAFVLRLTGRRRGGNLYPDGNGASSQLIMIVTRTQFTLPAASGVAWKCYARS